MEITLLFMSIVVIFIIFAFIFISYKYVVTKIRSTEIANEMFERWRMVELEKIKADNLEIARREMQVEFEKWKNNYEQLIRQDAVQKSKAVISGKVAEQFVPFLPDFSYNPKDVRFIGSPVDLIVFHGLYDDEIKKIVFVEVKTGNSTLNTRERSLRDAVLNKNVEWLELRPVNIHVGKEKYHAS